MVWSSKSVLRLKNHPNQRWITNQNTDTDILYITKWIVFETKFKTWLHVKFNSKDYSQICISEHFKTKKIEEKKNNKNDRILFKI